LQPDGLGAIIDAMAVVAGNELLERGHRIGKHNPRGMFEDWNPA
jgi:hypothetical protein